MLVSLFVWIIVFFALVTGGFGTVLISTITIPVVPVHYSSNSSDAGSLLDDIFLSKATAEASAACSYSDFLHDLGRSLSLGFEYFRLDMGFEHDMAGRAASARTVVSLSQASTG